MITTTTRYWDLDGAERAALSEQDISRLCDIELMVAGILRPEPLKLLDEEPVPLSCREVFVIEVAGRYGAELLNVAFPNVEAAQTFLRIPGVLRRVNEYGEVEHVRPLLSTRVVGVSLPDETECAARKAELDRVRTAKAENEKARQAHKKQHEAVEKALAGLWQDYRAQNRLANRLAEVRRTWETYKAMTNGNEEMALGFLRKAFPNEYWECRSEDVDLVAEATGRRG